MTQNNATFLSPYDYDHRDFVANNVLKNLDKLKPPKFMKRNITETYEQGKLGSCTAMATTHSMKIQNEVEYQRKIDLRWQFLRGKMGHSLVKYDWGDSIENAVKTGLKHWIEWTLDWKPIIYEADAWCYWVWAYRKKALMINPLICVIRGNVNTRWEMIRGEVKTVLTTKQITGWHAVLLCGYDENWVYFYNSFSDKKTKWGRSEFKISMANFQKMLQNMITWRYFMLLDKKELKDWAIEIEIAKQIIKPAKKLYEIWDQEIKEYFQKIWLTKMLETKYGFKY